MSTLNIKEINDSYVYVYNSIKIDKKRPITLHSTMSDHQIFIMPKIEPWEKPEWFNDYVNNRKDYLPCGNFTLVIPDILHTSYIHYFSCNFKDGFTFCADKKTCRIPNMTIEQLDHFSLTTLDRFIVSLKNKETRLGVTQINTTKRSGKSIIIPITYISNKKYTNDIQSKVSAPIEWKHSWEVLGHWRVIDGIGKDRNDHYVEINRTWVKPCIKGNGELVKKIRVLK